jgi:hypothetical protein
MENARQRVHQLTIDIMRASRTQGGGPGMPQQYGMPQQVRALLRALIRLCSRSCGGLHVCLCLPHNQLPLSLTLLVCYATAFPVNQAAPVSIPSCLLLLPLYSMSLQKNAVIRGGNDTRVDERAYFQQLLFNMDIDEVRRDAAAVCGCTVLV